mgnify:CR=1 FL=1
MKLQSSLTIQRAGIMVITLILVYFAFDWGPPSQLGYDVFGYYVYFHEFVFNGNLSIENLEHYETLNNTYNYTDSLYQFSNTGKGTFITRYPIGWTIFYGPFLLIGHLIAHVTDYPVDGMSYPYQLMVKIGAMVYAFLSLSLLAKILNHFLKKLQSLLVILFVVFGTHYFHITTVNSCMPHLLLFFLYTALIYFTIKYHKEGRLYQMLLIGLTLGLMVITRPTELIAAIIPLFWNFKSWKSLLSTWLKKDYLYAALLFGVIVSIQLIFWKITTGKFLFYSYQSAGEGLDLLHPHTWDFLFSFRKGLFVYTPILLLSIVGLIYLFKQKKEFRWAVLLFMLFYTYVVSSWTNWWYAASFSSRGIFQGLALFIIPMAIVAFKLKGVKKIVTIVFSFACVGLNLFQTWQIQNGILDGAQMTKDYYFSVFGQTSMPTNEQKDLLLPHHDINTLDTSKYELYKVEKMQLDSIIGEMNPFYTVTSIPFTELDAKYPMIIECTMNAEYADSSLLLPATDITSFIVHNGKKYSYNATSLQAEKQKLKAKLRFANSYVRNERDKLGIEIWARDGKNVYLKDFTYKIWRLKKQYQH